VDGEHVVVLAPIAELAEEIDVERARRALEEAEQRLAQLGAPAGGGAAPEEAAGHGDRARIEAEESRRRAEVRLEVTGQS
jgi:F0F1-type ATP synthase epsilon subunit